MARRLKSEPKKTTREYWLEDINNRLVRTSFAICKFAQIDSGVVLKDKEIEKLIDGVIRALVDSQKSAKDWIKEHK